MLPLYPIPVNTHWLGYALSHPCSSLSWLVCFYWLRFCLFKTYLKTPGKMVAARTQIIFLTTTRSTTCLLPSAMGNRLMARTITNPWSVCYTRKTGVGPISKDRLNLPFAKQIPIVLTLPATSKNWHGNILPLHRISFQSRNFKTNIMLSVLATLS